MSLDENNVKITWELADKNYRRDGRLWWATIERTRVRVFVSAEANEDHSEAAWKAHAETQLSHLHQVSKLPAKDQDFDVKTEDVPRQ